VDQSIPIREMPGGTSLFIDCWEGSDGFLSLVPRHFRDPSSFKTQVDLLSKRRYARKTLFSALLQQNESFLAGSDTIENIQRLVDPRSVVVIGGQQAGLFGGPLYTLYKALTVAALARRLAADLERPVIPVFWIASEDHDLAEVNHTCVTSAAGELIEISMGDDDGRRIPISDRRLGEGAARAFSKLTSALSDVGLPPELESALRQTYREGAGYAQAFGTWMQFILKNQGIAFIDPSEDRIKRLAIPLFRREIEEKGPVSRSVIRHTARMEQLGYQAQIGLREGMLTLFHQDPVREAILVRESGFELKDGSRRFTQGELVSLLEDAPGKLSPNAALRPLFQDWIFPTIAAVLGPSELAYYAQLTQAYGDMEIPMPILFPRTSLTLIEPEIARLLTKHRLTLRDVVTRGPRVIDEIARREVPRDIFQGLAAGRSGVEGIWRGLVEEVGSLDPTLRPTAENAKGRSLRQFDLIEKKIVKAARRKNETLQRQVDRIIASLFPRGGIQERSLNSIPFLARYGLEVFNDAFGRMDFFSAEHRGMEIGG
jgi:bacillithiol biosynthesis cysteine-adding enzyme BshC